MKIPFGKPLIGTEEKKAVLDVLEGPILVHGPRAAAFEEAFAGFTGAPCCVAVSSCTAAMHLAYFDLGIGPGDDVIVPAQTHNATAHAVEYTGARPIFVDADMATGNIDIDQIEASLSPRTKAIAVVHFAGLPVDMDRVNAIAAQHDLFVLEDCALALGARYQGKHAGLLGNAGCFSFYPVKHMTTAEGGMLITSNESLAERIRRKRAFGVNRSHSRRAIPGVYDVDLLGYNYRMNEMQAALGIAQLNRLDGFLARRRANYQALSTKLMEIDEISLFQSTHRGFQSSYYCLSILLEPALRANRFEIVQFLKDSGIGTSVYYPKPVPVLKYYRDKYGYREEHFPNAAAISNGTIALPVGPHLDLPEMAYISRKVKAAITRTK